MKTFKKIALWVGISIGSAIVLFFALGITLVSVGYGTTPEATKPTVTATVKAIATPKAPAKAAPKVVPKATPTKQTPEKGLKGLIQTIDPTTPVKQKAPDPVAPAPAEPDAPVIPSTYFANCKEAKAAGAAPLMLGEPGYRPELDRDRDGRACTS